MREPYFLTVIIPIYNAEKFLPDCIESILGADTDRIELILVDDGSTDGSASLCFEYSEKYPNIRFIQQKNSGPSAARNNALGCASGEYIAFVDSDDYVAPQAFAHQLSMLERTAADIWVSDFNRVADNGCVLDEVFQIKETAEPITEQEYIYEFLSAKDCVWNVWRYFFRRSFLEEHGLEFAEGFNIAEDLEFVIRAFCACENIAFYHEPYYFYRVNYGSSLTRQFSAEKIRQLMWMLQRAMGHLNEKKADKLLKAKLAREYILNLSALFEVPADDRAAALASIRQASWLMKEAKGIYSCAGAAVKVLGIPTAAGLLYMMKRVKRIKRGLKMKCFDRRLG